MAEATVSQKKAALPRPFVLTTIGKKYLMAISGIIWAGFILGHMAGNLLMFVSADAYNAYGHAITSGMLIYAIEGGLLLALVTHVTMAVLLTIENRSARGTGYAMKPHGSKGPNFASQTMAIQGSIILAFLILHILTFKYGTYYSTTVNGVEMRDLYRLLVEVFQQPVYVIGYIFSLILLGFHLSHGFGSIFQSLGIRNDSTAPLIHKASWAYAIIVAGGFITQPIIVFLKHS